MNLKTLPEEEKPRERLMKYGKENISTNELIEIILKSGNRKCGLKEISHNILSSVNNINELKDKEINTLANIDGMSKIKAVELVAAIELGRRVYEDNNYKELVYLTNPSSIINYFHELFKNERQENFYVVYLDNQKKYIDKKLLFKGTVNFSLVHPREVFKSAYLLSASYIICIHNHPSGDASPSNNDIELTRRLKEIGDIHGVPVLDHIVIGNNNYYSFFEDNNILNGK
ncbi:MAG: DNA repair protein RadC [Bacilli bacterium]|nr:DNA repair protein RadC [Bacilli bacterium]